MIRYTAGFAPKDDSKPTEKAASPTLPSVEAAKAAADARQQQVLDYTRETVAEAPLKENLRTDGPTFEMWVSSGYLPEKYPPVGYAEKPSAALDEYRAQQTAAALSTAAVESLSTVQVASLTTAQVPSLSPHSINEHPEVPK